WRCFAERTLVLDYPGGRLHLAGSRQDGAALKAAIAPTLALPYDDRAGLPLVQAQIHGIPLALLMDTGAPFSTLDREVAQTLPAPSGVTQLPLRSQRVPLDL